MRDSSGAISTAPSASSELVPLAEVSWVLPKPSATTRKMGLTRYPSPTP